MNKKICYFLFLFAALFLFINCSNAKMDYKPTSEPLAKIVVYVGEVPPGESGRSASGTEINVGGSVILTAQGRDAKGNYIPVKPTWTPSKPGIIEITPKVGDKVTVKGIQQGSLDIYVEYKGVRAIVEYFFVK